MLAGLWRQRDLVLASVMREVFSRYRGSLMGILWSFLNPLFMLMIYTFVFSGIFNARWEGNQHSRQEFSLILFPGLIAYNLFAECIIRSPTTIITNQNFVKKVIFPLEILPLISLGSAIFHAFVSYIVWFFAYIMLIGTPPATALYLPLVLIPLIFFTLGTSWLLSSLGVYLRDMAQFIGILTTALMFVSPIFYPASALPENFRFLIFINPLTPAIEQTRAVMYWGHPPNFTLLFWSWMIAGVIAWLGYAWFQKTRKGFADVL